MPIVYALFIRPAAKYEADDIATWYEHEKAGLGFEFIAMLDFSFKKIQQKPTVFGYYQKGKSIRKFVMKRFPYKIFYLLEDSHIIILAIIHTSRSNRSIQQKLK